MAKGHKGRDALALIVSISVHVALVSALAVIPARSKKKLDTVDMSVLAPPSQDEKPPVAPVPENEVETPEAPDKKDQPKKPKPAKSPPKEPVAEPDNEPPPLAPPEEEPAPEEAEEASPVFDLGDNTFASGDGSGASWSLNRSEGNTKFAPVAKKKQPSVRGTQAKGDERGVSGGEGTGYAPVPIKNLSKRPMPRYGSIKVPPYPPEARREGIEGTVVLQVFIGKTGSVKRVRIIKDPGGGLGRVAKVAMLKERWTAPLNKAGDAVDTVIVYSYRFVLDG